MNYAFYLKAAHRVMRNAFSDALTSPVSRRCHMVLSSKRKETDQTALSFIETRSSGHEPPKIIIKSWLVFNITPSGNCCTSHTAGVAV